jgi:aminobenzoyl-glutamate utilization protein B
MFKGVDANIFAHVNSGFGTGYGDLGLNGMVSVEYTFHGKTAHSAAMPWDGRSALDGVELMDVAWNFRREHLPLSQRSHYVISDGGGQPNVVPGTASVWYYFRDTSFAAVRNLYETGNQIAQGAALQTGTTVTRQVLGYAAPNFGNKPMAEAAYANIKAVGMPKWSADDQAFAAAIQKANGSSPHRCPRRSARCPRRKTARGMGASDDIGDVMWTVPTITIGYPSNVPNVIFHHATAAMAMATPIAHKGAVVGAKAAAMTILDLMTTPKLLADAKDYFQNVQLKTQTYDPVIVASDKPAIHRNETTMAQLRPFMEKYYYDAAKYPTYLDQLGIKYPNLDTGPAK